MLKLLLFVGTCAIGLSPVRARLCQDVEVWNTVSEFEPNLRNCTTIVGHLKILLVEAGTPEHFANMSFPALTEIKGFFFMYRVYGLTSIGKLFPNLAIIRGQRLFLNYAIVIYNMPNLREIGLYNLKYIERGSTKIGICPELCYVYTIDWTRISNPSSHELDYFDDDNAENCQSCPDTCKGSCWNQERCQDIPTVCHPECIGCNGTTEYNCTFCRNYVYKEQCVKECPDDRIGHPTLGACIKHQECASRLTGTYWVFQKKCIDECPPQYVYNDTKKTCEFCGNKCRKVCPGNDYSSIASIQRLYGCTIINGSLTIRINSKSADAELEKNLGMIEEITEYLKIYRSSSITTLEFFKNLKIIHGKQLYNKHHALVVYENPYLNKLWNWDNFTIKIKNGSLLFHYNAQLCLSEIQTLARLSNISYTELDVSHYSNGDKRACIYVELNVTMQNLTSTNVTLTWTKFVINDEKVAVVGYVLYYIQDPFGNTTIYDERDECEGNNWDTTFTSNNTHQIVNLNAYTQYSYYIKVYTTPPSQSGQTTVKQFTTLSDDPTEPSQILATASDSHSVTLVWKPPVFTNGELARYELVVYYEKDDEQFIAQRNYCEHPHRAHIQEVEEEPIKAWSNHSVDSSCCKKERSADSKFDGLCVMTTDLKSLCKDYMYFVGEGNEAAYFTNISNVFDLHPSRSKRAYVPSERIEKTIEGNHATTYVLQNLKHFSTYIFLLKACNHNPKEQCSGSVMATQRTLPKLDADDIPPGISVNIEKFDVVLKWSEPKNPNSYIVSYHVEHKKTDLEHAKTVTECITSSDFKSAGFEYHMRNFLPGQYSIRVQATSLAGPGRFSELLEFQILVPSRHPWIGFILAAITVLIAIVLIGGFHYYQYYHKKKFVLDQQHLISSGSAEYSGPIYAEDDWELDRDDVDMCKEIGRGSFGVVYNGFIKSQYRPCAVKTVDDKVDVYERIVFLNEASIMKTFSSAHHVVKLLGVVSRGQPPLVVMELMGRGDLKTFLRQSRFSFSGITCAEMYRMAAEISDGMMYLASKKFVHRDLAARNCMVSADHTVKIGDFGMTRDVYATDYYRKETGGLMPIRWMSPESLADGVFSSDSDVWSYGVLLWEMATLAEQPYQGLANEQVLQFVIAQGTLERPLECPDLLYEIMSACWKWKPNDRPLFTNIVEKLESHISQHFRFVSFYHSAEGEENRINAIKRVYNQPALSSPFSKATAVYWNAEEDDLSI